jgi:hypothetical protein
MPVCTPLSDTIALFQKKAFPENDGIGLKSTSCIQVLLLLVED